ncbi:MAG: hypothetical protein WBH40_16700 [Ignavibacteriaceae bacterium]
MSRFILIIVVGGFITYGITNLNQNNNVTRATENSVNNYSQTKARNIVNSTIQMFMSNVADDLNWRVLNPVTMNIFDGQATYTVTDTIFDGEDLIKFSVTAEVFGETKKVDVYAKPLDPFPSGVEVNAAITTNNDILTLGNLTVDGRDHNLDGTVLPGEGTYAIWTTETYSQSGASKVGGTNLSIDYAPSKNPDPSIIANNQTWPNGFPPNSPEEVIKDLPFNITLEEYAKSGDWESQYVNDPGLLTYPLKGVTYVELPSGEPWTDANIEGSGILIIHNDQVDAIIKNTYNNFTGLIIADDIIHLHSTIIGAVISLTQNPSEGNTIGNSDGFILYSKEALANSLMSVRPRNFGFAQNRLDVKHWFE